MRELRLLVNEAATRAIRRPTGSATSRLTQVTQCTLRAAIESANEFVGLDLIDFSIPGSGVHTIAVQSPLPAIQTPVVINGYSQAGASPNTDGFRCR